MPLKSELFYVLEHHHNPQIRESARLIRYLLSLTPESVPDLQAAIKVPEDFPQFTGSLSDMPDWVNAHISDSSDNDGKILSRRKRRQAKPYRRADDAQDSGSPPGKWIYDSQGLVFIPEQEAATWQPRRGNFPHVSRSGPVRAISVSSFNPSKLNSPLFEESIEPISPDDFMPRRFLPGVHIAVKLGLLLALLVLTFYCGKLNNKNDLSKQNVIESESNLLEPQNKDMRKK